MAKKPAKPTRKSPAKPKSRKPAAKKRAGVKARPAPKKAKPKAAARPAAKKKAGPARKAARAPAKTQKAKAKTAKPAPTKRIAPKKPVAKAKGKPAVKARPVAKAPKVVARLGSKGKPARKVDVKGPKIVAKPLPKGKPIRKADLKAPKIVAKPLPKGKPVPKVEVRTPKAPAKPAKVIAGKPGAASAAPPAKGASAKATAAAAPAHKPTPGEIAARIAGKRAADAATKKGRNGRHAEIAPRVLTPADVEARKRRLKTLIVLGKERGFLTFAEINDHLPDDVLDAEQIEGIVSMIGDMGIQVYDVAPDAETLLMSDAAPTAPAEDVEEAAEAAVSTLDSEFGRTTDPVRMYMREMGSVELLTREGEIEIAKRIEEGLKHMIMAISACPMTVAQILDLATKIEKDEFKIDDLVDGLMDFNEALDALEDVDDDVEASEDEGDAGAIAAENLERLKVAALTRFATIRKLHARMLVVLQKEGHKAPKCVELQKKVQNELMQIRFSARQVEKLCDSVRHEVDNIRQIERKIQDLVVN